MSENRMTTRLGRRVLFASVSACAVGWAAGFVATPQAWSVAVPASGPAGTTFQARNTVGVTPGMDGINGTVTLEDPGTAAVIATNSIINVVDCQIDLPLTVPQGTPPGVYNLRFKVEVGCPGMPAPVGIVNGHFTVTVPAPPVARVAPAPPAVEPEPPPPVAKHHPKPTNEERSRFAASVVAPGDIPFDLDSLARSGLLALVLAMLIGVPVAIFNGASGDTLRTFSRRFAPVGRFFSQVNASIPGAAVFGALVASILLGTAITVFINPGFPGDPGALAFLVGIFAGVAVVTGISLGTWKLYVRQRAPAAGGGWLVFGPFVAISLVMVLFSRILGFLPGLVLGTLADYKTDKPLSVKQKGQRVALTAAAGLAIGLGAWFAWAAVDSSASRPDAGFGIVAIDTALALIYVAGVQGFVFGLIPVRFLAGHSLYSWSRPLWLAMWAFGLFWFIHLIVQPALGTNEEGSGSKLVWAAGILGVMSILAAVVWVTSNRARTAKA